MKRRTFLQGMGGVALATPYLSSLRGRAYAQSVAPQRLVIFHTPQGCLTTRWFPQVEEGPLTASDLAGTTLDVLAPVVSKLLLPRGLTAINGMGRPQALDPHVQAMGSKLTCALIDPETRYPLSHSVDHEVARIINPSSAPPLVLSPVSALMDGASLLSYTAANAPVTPLSDPLSLYTQLTGISTGQALSEPAYRVALGKSSLDVVRDDLNRFKARNMSAADQRRVDQWLELLRQTEQQLTIDSPSSCGAQQVLTAGVADQALATISSQQPRPDTATSMTTGGDLMMNLMALAMICDSNRSIVFHYPNFTTFNWDGIAHNYDTDGLNHRTGSAAVSGDCVDGVLAMLDELDRWYAGKYYRLVALLDSIQEGDGTLLDNTATMWLREFSDGGAFNVNNMPILIAGSAGGYLKQGAAVLLEDEPVGPGNSEASCVEPGAVVGQFTGTDASRGLVPINKLYVTLMNAVGCTAAGGGPVTEFGVFDGARAEDGITDPGELVALKA